MKSSAIKADEAYGTEKSKWSGNGFSNLIGRNSDGDGITNLIFAKITGRKNTSCFRQMFLSINIAYFSAAKKFYSCGGLRLAYRVIIKEILKPTATTTSKISNSKKAIAAIPNAGQPSPLIATPYFPYSIRRIPQDTLQWQT